MLKRIVAGLIVAAMVVAAGSPAAYAQGCLSDAQARQAFASGQARPLAAFMAAIIAAVGGGNAAGAQLCQVGGRLVWRVVWLSGSGQRTITVDAVSGAIH
jgi:uncharacterized membrane protein YkoI